MGPGRQTIGLDNLVLGLCYIVNLTSMGLVPSPEQALPPSNGVGTDEGVRGREVYASVPRGGAVCF